MPIEKESWYVYATDKGISKAKAQEYWTEAKKAVDKKESDFSDADWKHVMGVFKKIISNATKKEACEVKKMDMEETEEEQLRPFLGYAKDEGIEEDQAKAIFYSVRGSVAKKQDKEPDKLGGEDMGILWGEYKDAIENAKKKQESFTLNNNYILEGYSIKKGSTIIIEATTDIKVKHPDILEIPEDKNFYDMPLSHYISLAKRIGKSAVMKALLNQERWNKNDDPDISKKARKIIDSLMSNSEWKDIEPK